MYFLSLIQTQTLYLPCSRGSSILLFCTHFCWELRLTCGFHDSLQTDDFWSFLPRLTISWTLSKALSLVSRHTSTLICPKLNSLCPPLLLTKPNPSHHSHSCSSYKLQPWGQQSYLHSHLRPGTQWGKKSKAIDKKKIKNKKKTWLMVWIIEMYCIYM